MWIEKTPQEIAADASKKQSGKGRWFLYATLRVFLMIPFFFKVGRLAWRPGPFVRSMDDVMQHLHGMTFIFLLAVIFMQVFKVPVLKRKRVVICPKCEAAKDDNGDYSCPCCGCVEDNKTMKWVEDNNKP